MTIAGCLKDSNCCRVTDSAAVFARHHPGLVLLLGESLRSIQDSGSLSSVSAPVRNILYLFPLGFSVGLPWTALGLLVIPVLLCGTSTAVEYCFLVFSLTTGSLTSPQILSGKLLLVFAGFCYPCYYLLLVEKVPNWPPFGAQTWHSMSRLAEDFLPAPSLFKVILAWKIFFFYLYLCLYDSL